MKSVYVPPKIKQHIFSFLHQPYDYEKQQVMNELEWKCRYFRRQRYDLSLIDVDPHPFLLACLLS